MARTTTPSANRVPIERPLLLLVAGLVLLGAAWLLAWQLPDHHGIRLALLVAGVGLTFAGVVERLRKMTWTFAGRVEASATVSASSLGAGAALFAMAPQWTSGRIFFGGLLVLTLVGAALILMPPLARRLALSLIILFHLGGIATAITIVDPPNSTAPWISQFLMARVYRPYLNLLYMTNAYHFYSPDPGTSSMMWFAVHYSDKEYRWIKVPNKADSPVGMTYQRLNALPEQCFAPIGRFPPNEIELRGKDRPVRGSWEDIYRRREHGSKARYKPNDKPIPWVVDVDIFLQYQQPTDLSQRQIASLARHIWHLPAAQREGATITSVKVYRVRINVLTPYELSKGRDPFDPEKRQPYFLGEFDREGTLLHPLDPFLYWYLPVQRVSYAFPRREDALPVIAVRVDPPKDSFLLDCLEMHAATPSPAEQKEPK